MIPKDGSARCREWVGALEDTAGAVRKLCWLARGSGGKLGESGQFPEGGEGVSLSLSLLGPHPGHWDREHSAFEGKYGAEDGGAKFSSLWTHRV